ncbi:hypothetical protein QAD02_023734 [Eretmocerus hayati]|uniref:Uncharacterized protein n=1 Tax=Eretmocerus hayati TaxID=131215 RepID=A0ACC2PWG0_9HYME|nr:hypothetical protein QAD02_023734 [Eretmocerus hayati]
MRKYSDWKAQSVKNASRASTAGATKESDDDIIFIEEVIKSQPPKSTMLLAALGGIEQTNPAVISGKGTTHSIQDTKWRKSSNLSIKQRCQEQLGRPIPIPPPTPGVITGVKPWEPLTFPRTMQGLEAALSLIQGGYGVVSNNLGGPQIVEAAGVVMISADRLCWTCKKCYKIIQDKSQKKKWLAHRIHVLGLENSIPRMDCACGRSGYKTRRLSASCDACVDVCLRHILDVEMGIIVEAEFDKVGASLIHLGINK